MQNRSTPPEHPGVAPIVRPVTGSRGLKGEDAAILNRLCARSEVASACTEEDVRITITRTCTVSSRTPSADQSCSGTREVWTCVVTECHKEYCHIALCNSQLSLPCACRYAVRNQRLQVSVRLQITSAVRESSNRRAKGSREALPIGATVCNESS